VCSINETVDEILTLANYWLVLMARESIKVWTVFFGEEGGIGDCTQSLSHARKHSTTL
jgi:hypothetical protein